MTNLVTRPFQKSDSDKVIEFISDIIVNECHDDIAIDFAKSVGYSRIVLDSSKALHPARALYLKNGFVDIPRYNDNYRADVFMERRLT